ncbi:uncharacterized protein BXZ73DRAFT_55268 [Epithele typhae]|uniref:uncharacterized protein n=1 Tax=Epithele typhae TaxID=378194 RepID=UPI00200770AB|nr:uncharacterized protein BXZ73DRAFT_55268 [Epithele typhae]KAH9913879.1 hypothetical protein BXZ73DRAFT_55268 [Epithele typhae]
MHNLFLGILRHHCISIWDLKSAERRKDKASTKSAHTPEQQEKILRSIRKAVDEKHLSTLTSVRKDYLLAVAAHNKIPESGVKLSKADVARSIYDWVHVNRNVLNLPTAMNRSTVEFQVEPQYCHDSRSALFSNDVLQAVRRGIDTISLPSWVEKPPSNLGDPAAGKLKADHWRTISTIHMTIVLPALWGTSSATSSEREALKNFSHLVAAVDLASRRVMTKARAEKSHEYTVLYLSGLRSLYRADLVPNHHLCLHLKDFLCRFGPPRAWWAFVFERQIGNLEGINTNGKAEDIPTTYVRTFYTSARARDLFASTKWPDEDAFTKMMQSHLKTSEDQARGSRIVDGLSGDTVSKIALWEIPARTPRTQKRLEGTTYDYILKEINNHSKIKYCSPDDHHVMSPRVFLPSTANFVNRMSLRGILYTTRDSGRQNSLVLFRKRGSTAPSAGRIENIFEHSRYEKGEVATELFIEVGEFEPLCATDERHDPYRRYPDIQTWLVYNNVFKTHIMCPTDVIAHFASCEWKPREIERSCLVVRSLDRVSPLHAIDILS